MKTNSLRWAGLCTLLSFCMIFCTMCKKKDDATPPSTLQRISGYKVYYNDTLAMKGVFTYSGNLGTELIVTDTGSTEIQKSTFEYSGNEIISTTDYERINGVMAKYSFIEVNGYTGPNPSEVVTHLYNYGDQMEPLYIRMIIREGSCWKMIQTIITIKLLHIGTVMAI